MSFGAYAYDTTCQVFGSKNQNIATIKNPIIKVGESGDAYVRVSLTKKADEDTQVVIKLYDQKGYVVATEVAEISAGSTTPTNGWICIEDVPAGTYYAKIARASCN